MLQTRDETGQDNAGLWLLNTFHTFMFALIIFWSTLLSFLRIQKLLRQLQKFLVMLGFTGWLWCLIFWKFYKAEFPQRFNGLRIRTLLLRVLVILGFAHIASGVNSCRFWKYVRKDVSMPWFGAHLFVYPYAADAMAAFYAYTLLFGWKRDPNMPGSI